MAIAPDSKQPTSHTDSRGNAVVVKAPPAPVIKTHTDGGVLGGAHMGGHSDVAAMQTKLAAQGLKPQSPAELKKIMQNDLNNTVQKNAPSMQQFQAQMSKKYLDKK